VTEKILETSSREHQSYPTSIVELAGDYHPPKNHLKNRTFEILLVSEYGTVDALRMQILIPPRNLALIT